MPEPSRGSDEHRTAARGLSVVPIVIIVMATVALLGVVLGIGCPAAGTG